MLRVLRRHTARLVAVMLVAGLAAACAGDTAGPTAADDDTRRPYRGSYMGPL